MSFEGDAGGEVNEPQGGGVGGAEGAPTQGQQQGGQGGSEDPIARVLASMDAFSSQFGQLGQRFDAIEARLPPQEQQGEEEPEGFDLAALLEELPDDAFGDDGQITPEGNMELMRQVARAEADAVRTEQQQAAIQAEHDQYAGHLEQKYTDLQDPQMQQQVLALATQRAQQMRQPELASNPYFFEQVYLSMKYAAHAAAEVPAGQNDSGVRLEQPGGGGGPVGAQNGGDQRSTQQRIVDATRSTRFRLGSAS